MSLERTILTPQEHAELELTALSRHQLEEQFENLEQQHEVATLGMWVFLATEVMFFGTLFLGLGIFRMLYADAFEAASVKLNWVIGGTNTVVLLVSSLSMVLAVHYSKLGQRRRVLIFLAVTAFLGLCFVCLKGLEYYIDYLDDLIPGWAFNDQEWLNAGLNAEQIPHVKLFLLFYWIMTGFHALHMIIGITAVSIMFVLTWRNVFTPTYYSPIDVTALYWHFVDLVWIFLLPMLYLQGTH